MKTKERIILADTDINYIISIQQKFAEELFEQADIEVITDQDYFQSLFSTPQQASVLIVSEDLYNNDLQRHNISHIFLMSEKDDNDDNQDLSTTTLYKYTSVKEIYNVVIGKSLIQPKALTAKNKQTQIVLVYSANGGVGKTTVAMGISACLSKSYKRVLYLNASRLQTFPSLIENHTPIPTDAAVNVKNAEDDIYLNMKYVIRKEAFAYLPPFKLALMSLDIAYKVYRDLALAAKQSNDYDFIIVDADCTFDEEKAELLNIADKVILVCEQTRYSVSSMNHLIANINKNGSDKYIFVCNKFDKNKENALVSHDKVNFTISEYIEQFNDYEKITMEQLAKENSLQKLAYLMI